MQEQEAALQQARTEAQDSGKALRELRIAVQDMCERYHPPLLRTCIPHSAAFNLQEKPAKCQRYSTMHAGALPIISHLSQLVQ